MNLLKIYDSIKRDRFIICEVLFLNKFVGIIFAVVAILVAFLAIYWVFLRMPSSSPSDGNQTRVIVGDADGSSSVFNEKSKSFEDNNNNNNNVFN